MSGFDWFLIGFWSLGIVLQPWSVGKTRPPRTAGQATFALLVSVAFIVCLLWSRGALS